MSQAEPFGESKSRKVDSSFYQIPNALCLVCQSQLTALNKNVREPQQLYSNILCEECKMGMSSKDRQMEIFGQLINFFEPHRSEKGKQKSSETSGKMKIKDLVRLVMHVLNEVSGLSMALYSLVPTFPSQVKQTLLPYNSNLNPSYSFEINSKTIHDTRQKVDFSNDFSLKNDQIASQNYQDPLASINSKVQNLTTPTQGQIGFDSFENTKLLTRRTNVNGTTLIQPLKGSFLDKRVGTVNERTVRTESDETDEFEHGSFKMAAQIRRHSVKTKSLLATQPMLKRATMSVALPLSNKQAFTPTLLDEVNSFFTHQSPSAKLNHSKNSNSILSSTQYATGVSELLVQTSQIDLQLDGSFNNEGEFSKTVPGPHKQFADRLLSFPDSSDEIEPYLRKSSLISVTKKVQDPFNLTETVSSQKPVKSFAPLVPSGQIHKNLIPSAGRDRNDDSLKLVTFQSRLTSHGNPIRSSSPNCLPHKISQKVEPPRSISCSRNVLEFKQNSQFRSFHPRSKSSLQGTKAEYLPSSLIQSRSGSNSFQQSTTQQDQVIQKQSQFQQLKMTKAQERTIIKAIMREQYGDQYKEGVHKCTFFFSNQQQFIFFLLIEDQGEINEAKILISAEWWRNWLEYVDFHQQNPGLEFNYHPGEIINQKLLKPRYINESNSKNFILKDDLLEHYDYEAVPKRLFDHLYTWYSSDYQIVRFLKYDPSKSANEQTFLDLYPEKSTGLALPSGVQRKRQVISSNITQKDRERNSNESDQINNSRNDKESLINQKPTNQVISHAEDKSSYCQIF